jgi:peptidoglycan/xylan/chitin deacetylase (PgdA/CDA1 family)
VPSARPADARPGAGQPRAPDVRGVVARPVQVRLEKPVISFTFDDFPKSAGRNAAAVLEAMGGRATFYAASAFAGLTTQYGAMFDGDDITRLAAAGHEIGCGTFTSMDCARSPIDDIFADMVRNADALAAMGLEARLVSFAYPSGHVSAALKQRLPLRFTTARGAAPGLAVGRIDFAQLPANALFGEEAAKRAMRLLDQARRKKAWLIFHAHDVASRPTAWGAPTGLLERIVTAAYASGVEIAPVREVAARILAATPD